MLSISFLDLRLSHGVKETIEIDLLYFLMSYIKLWFQNRIDLPNHSQQRQHGYRYGGSSQANYLEIGDKEVNADDSKEK